MWLDAKIVIYTVSTVLAYCSHFVFKLPHNAYEVAGCLAAYSALMALHYFIESYKEKGAFFIVSSHEVSYFACATQRILRVVSDRV